MNDIALSGLAKQLVQAELLTEKAPSRPGNRPSAIACRW